QNGRNAHDLIAPRDLGIFIGVQLSDFELAGIFLSQFIDDGRDHLTRTAPNRPKIHHHQLRRLDDFGFPCRIIDFQDITTHGCSSFAFSTNLQNVSAHRIPRFFGLSTPAPNLLPAGTHLGLFHNTHVASAVTIPIHPAPRTTSHRVWPPATPSAASTDAR